ncbi:hypothetical protein TIFTF001_040307 [Ficus carica]|uniref:Uncharacterized protein n=1 Tax=Ficus carica TaxID=3494 RepID=A0AA87Z6X6_FICCA|nr:hypothetical protein TIFTF001_040307 [Ficus carica]
MVAEREHQEELPQGSSVDHQEALTSEANTQIANLTRLVEELTRKHDSQQNQMENITAENQILKNQLMSINSQAAYSYYYPYFGYSTGASAGGWNPATSQHPQGVNTGGWQPSTSHDLQGTNAGGLPQATPHQQRASRATYSPVAPMQPLFTPGDTPVINEWRAQQRHTASRSEERRWITHTRRSTPVIPAPTACLIPQGTMNV